MHIPKECFWRKNMPRRSHRFWEKNHDLTAVLVFVHVRAPVTSGLSGLVRFFGGYLVGLKLSDSSPPPSLCTELTCSALALIIYSERERRGVSAFCLQGSTSVSSFNLQVLWHFSSHTILVSHHALPPSLSVSSISLLFCLSFKFSLCRSCSFICLLVVQTARLFSEMLCRCAVLYFACQETEIIFFHVCSTPIILPGVTDGSACKQRSWGYSVIALHVRGHGESFTNITWHKLWLCIDRHECVTQQGKIVAERSKAACSAVCCNMLRLDEAKYVSYFIACSCLVTDASRWCDFDSFGGVLHVSWTWEKSVCIILTLKTLVHLDSRCAHLR